MSEKVSSTVNSGSIEVKFDVLHNKKFQSSVIYVRFNTTETTLLSLLLQKYCSEKVLTCGVNQNNNIYSAIPGQTSIVLFAPENKIVQNILFLFSYLHKTKLNSLQSKLCKSGSYSKLCSDISKFSVNITGKCKNFAAALTNTAPKIERFKQSLSTIACVARDDISNNDAKFDLHEITFDDCNSNVALYLSIVLGSTPCTITQSGKTVKLTVLCENGRELVHELSLWKDTFQAKIKSFLTQSGSVGSPSANDKGGVAFKAKCKHLLECENELAFIYSDVRGFTHTFKDVDELKKVDSAAMVKVRGLK